MTELRTTKKKKKTASRGNSERMFPGRLHDLLEYVESQGLDSVVSWVGNGTAFMVHKPDQLLQLLSFFFGQTKYRSFTRQLNMWYFQREEYGPFKGAFSHPYFIKGKKELCAAMSRHEPPQKNPLQLLTDPAERGGADTMTTNGAQGPLHMQGTNRFGQQLFAASSVTTQREESSDRLITSGAYIQRNPMFTKNASFPVKTLQSKPCREEDLLFTFNIEPTPLREIPPTMVPRKDTLAGCNNIQALPNVERAATFVVSSGGEPATPEDISSIFAELSRGDLAYGQLFLDSTLEEIQMV